MLNDKEGAVHIEDSAAFLNYVVTAGAIVRIEYADQRGINRIFNTGFLSRYEIVIGGNLLDKENDKTQNEYRGQSPFLLVPVVVRMSPKVLEHG